MSATFASKLVSCIMRTAIMEAISPANQGTRHATDEVGTLVEAGRVSRQFGHELHQQTSAYTGSVDEFGCPGNTVDSWRLEFSQKILPLEAANGTAYPKRRQG